MSAITSEQRRIAVVGDTTRVDLSAPVGHTIGDALDSAGLNFVAGRDMLIDHAGREIATSTLVRELDDGALITVIDLTQGSGSTESSRSHAYDGRVDYQSTWWLLAMGAVLLAAGALAALAAEAPLLQGTERLWIAASLALGALATAALWVARASTKIPSGPSVVATLMLAFAAGALAVPDATASVHLAVTVGLLAAATLGVAMAVAARELLFRAISATLSVLLLVYAGIWGATLLLGWDITAPAAITLGLIAPAIRFLPTALLPLADGYSISYKHFMSSRWTVRGTIPEDPGAVVIDTIRPTVAVAAARLRTGTIALCVTAPLVAPLVIPGMQSDSLLVRIGSVGLIIVVVAALSLMPRRGTDPVAAWVSRAVAAVVVIEASAALTLNAGETALAVGAALLLVAGILTAAFIVPVSKGLSSLAWSRVGDAVEALSVAFALPFALLAANVIELVREMMSG